MARNRREIRPRAFLGVVAASLCLWTGVAHAITPHVTDDAYIQQKSSHTQSGSAAALAVANHNLNKENIAYALFDLSLLPPDAATNERRDREAKLKLYSRRGVLEYWIMDWWTQQVEVYQRTDLALRLVATLYPADMLTSPLLPGFVCQVATLFAV